MDVSNGGRLFLPDEEKRRLSKGIKSVKAYEPDDGRILAEKRSKATKLYKPDRRLANDCGVCIQAVTMILIQSNADTRLQEWRLLIRVETGYLNEVVCICTLLR